MSRTTKRRCLFFYGGPFSQWYPCKLIIDDVLYNCAEQYMMAKKALLFGDRLAHLHIMEGTDPARQKALGRLVHGYDDSVWHPLARDVVFRANLHKFAFNHTLRKELLQTGNDCIVEASPTDRIWGIGLGMDDPNLHNVSAWCGHNWLGEVLMEVRDALKKS